MIYDNRHEVDFCEIIWSIKDSHIGTNFLDAGASTFFVSDHVFNTRSKENLSENNDTTHSVEKANDISDAQVFTPHSLEKEKMARKKAAVESNNQPSVEIDESLLSNNTADNKYSGAALGPRWQTQVVLHKEGENTMKASAPKTVEFETTATRIFLKHEYEVFYNSRLQENPKTEKTSKVYLPLPSSQGGETWPIYVQLSNDKIYGCDFVVSATGVIPNSSIVGPEVHF